MNHKIANILKGYIEPLPWIDKISGLVQTANIRKRVKGTNNDDGNFIHGSFPISCDIDLDTCINGTYQDLAPASKKKSVLYFEDHGGTPFIARIGNKIKFRSLLRLVCWLNLKRITGGVCHNDGGDCGVSGDYVIDILKILPDHPFSTPEFVSIYITSISQVERSVDIFSRYTYHEEQTQYLMYPYDYFALDIEIEFTIPCIFGLSVDSTVVTVDDMFVSVDD